MATAPVHPRTLPVTPDELLACTTPPAWLRVAVERLPTLLLDHAACEKKAASTALALMFRYPADRALCDTMSRLAREELRHFEQVQRVLVGRGIAPGHVPATRYAAGLRRLVRAGEPRRLVDTLICGAFIEARSCERFARLVPALDDDLGRFYAGLEASESRHFRVYLALAAERSDDDIAARIAQFAEAEADLIGSPDEVFGFHSGVPVS